MHDQREIRERIFPEGRAVGHRIGMGPAIPAPKPTIEVVGRVSRHADEDMRHDVPIEMVQP